MFYIFDGYYMSNQSELDWYKKAEDFLSKHGLWNDEDGPFWIATLNLIFMEFCYLICDESCDVDLETCLRDEGLCWSDLAKKFEVSVTSEMIEEYMEEEGLDSLTIEDFEKMFGSGIVFEKYLKEDLEDIIYKEHVQMKRDFLKVIKAEDGSDTMNVLFFFYVRQGRYDEAWKLYDGSGDLWSLHQPTQFGMYADREHVFDEENEEVTDEKTVLYSFVNGDALDSWRVLRVMEWIENGFEL